MRSLPFTLLSAGAVNAAALIARDNVISTSARDPAYARSFGQSSQLTTVSPGVTQWLSGGGTHNFYGNLDNSGTIVISQTDYLKQNPYAGGQTADFVGSTLLNGNLINRAGALISLNDYGSASAPTYDWYLHTMENRGSLQFCGRGDTGGSTYQLYCDETCYNYGIIDFEQYTRNLGASFVWRNDVIGANAGVNVYNEGAFRLVNVVYHNVQNVLGSGCWVVDEGSVLYLEDGSGIFQNPNKGPTFPNQKIYFTDADSPSGQFQTIHMDTAVYSQNSDFGPEVYNFGGNRAIEFYETIKSFSYGSGVLTVIFVSSNQVNIKIGNGYDSTGFYNSRNPQHYNVAGYNAIFYRGSAPSRSIPGVCQVSLGKCADPENTVGISTSTTSSTRAATSTSSTLSTTAFITNTTTTSKSSASTSPAPSTIRTTAGTATSSSSVVPTSSSTSQSATSRTSSTSTTSTSTKATTSSSTAAVTTLSTSTTTATTSAATTSAATTSAATTSAATTSATTTPTTSAATSATTSSAIGNGPCANGAAPSSTYTTSNGDVFGICLNTDFPGPNLTPISGIQTAEQCAEVCSKTANCIAGSLLRQSQTCYLKDTRNQASLNDGVDSVYKISSGSGSTTTVSQSATTTSSLSTSVITSTTTTVRTTTAPTTTTTTTTVVSSATTSQESSTTTTTGEKGRCADGRGPDRTYTAPNGDVYGVCLNTDFAGPNLGNPVNNISSPEKCADVCSQTTGCIAGSLVRDSQLCYLKNTNNSPVVNNAVDSVYKISSGSGGSTTTSVPATTTSISSRLSSSAGTSSITVTTASSMTTTRPSSIATTTTSSAATTSTAQITTTSVTTTQTATTSTTGTPGTGRCANGKGPDSTYTASNGDIYGVCLNTDFAGPNLANPVTGITTTDQCAEACSRTAGCIAGSLLRDAQLCYLKDTNNAPVVNNGVDSVYKISSGPGGSTTTTVTTTTAVTSYTTTKVVTSTTTVTASATSTTTTTNAGTTTLASTTSFTSTKVVTSTTTVSAPATTSGCSWVCVPHNEL